MSWIGKYKTWTPGPWTPSVDRVNGPPIFTTPKITEVNKNKKKVKLIISKLKKKWIHSNISSKLFLEEICYNKHIEVAVHN